jgi:hypothetical protein
MEENTGTPWFPPAGPDEGNNLITFAIHEMKSTGLLETLFGICT